MMAEEDPQYIIYKIAVSMTAGITAETIRRMQHHGVSPEEFITLPTEELSARLGLNRGYSFQQVYRDSALIRARQEAEYCRANHIRALFLSDEEYPPLLADAHDAPPLIYVLGNCDLSGAHFLSAVGTRRCTPYGTSFIDRLVKELAGYCPDLTVVSGLATGIDSAAHTSALAAGVKTIAVVAHGLHMIYPAANTQLARTIVNKGGAIVTEYPSGIGSFRNHFLARNRIIAGLSHVTIVAESEEKGGAMSTANYADSYHRQVCALPGRTSDRASSGCNSLIRRNKASLVGCAADVMEITGWQPEGVHVNIVQRNLFPELEGDPKIIYECLRIEQAPMSIDMIHYKTGLPVRRLLELMPELEFDGVLARVAGNKYMLV